MSKSEKRSGRPKGAKTAERACCLELPAACPGCKSTRREPYRDGIVQTLDFGGEIETPEGPRPYNRVVWRRTRCSDCGQQLTVREFHYSPEPGAGRVEEEQT
jgi:hypothetical protein